MPRNIPASSRAECHQTFTIWNPDGPDIVCTVRPSRDYMISQGDQKLDISPKMLVAFQRGAARLGEVWT